MAALLYSLLAKLIIRPWASASMRCWMRSPRMCTNWGFGGDGPLQPHFKAVGLHQVKGLARHTIRRGCADDAEQKHDRHRSTFGLEALCIRPL